MKKAVSQKTEKVLRKIIAYLEEEPKRLEMGHWGIILPEGTVQVDGVEDQSQPAPPCGTVACVAGTCLLVSKTGIDFLKEYGAIKKQGSTEYIHFPNSSPEKAASILGISEEKASSLFYFKNWPAGKANGWPFKFSKRYMKAKTPRGRFLATKARIENFIATGE